MVRAPNKHVDCGKSHATENYFIQNSFLNMIFSIKPQKIHDFDTMLVSHYLEKTHGWANTSKENPPLKANCRLTGAVIRYSGEWNDTTISWSGTISCGRTSILVGCVAAPLGTHGYLV